MANDYTNTSAHYIPVPAITDQWNFTREITNLRERLNKGMAGQAAYNSAADNYVLAATNAGAILSSAVSSVARGHVIGAASGQDPTLSFMTHDGAALTTRWAIGVDDSDSDAFKVQAAAALTTGQQFQVSANGDVICGVDTADILRAKGHIEHYGTGRFQTFGLGLRNNAGTLEHRVTSPGYSGAAAIFSDRVVGGSVTYQTLPDVAAGVDFTTGVGREAADPSNIILNTAAQSAQTLQRVLPLLMFNSTTDQITVEAFISNINVNGTTQNRLSLRFWASNGAAWDIDTTNLAASEAIQIHVFGFIE